MWEIFKKKIHNYTLVISYIPEVRTWSFYGKAVETIELCKLHVKNWPYGENEKEYQSAIQKCIIEREKYLLEHKKCAELLEKDIILLKKELV